MPEAGYPIIAPRLRELPEAAIANPKNVTALHSGDGVRVRRPRKFRIDRVLIAEPLLQNGRYHPGSAPGIRLSVAVEPIIASMKTPFPALFEGDHFRGLEIGRRALKDAET